LIRIGTLTVVVADLALLLAIFIRNGGRIWGPYLNPPVTVFWATPIFFVSVVLGVIGMFACGIGLVRPGGRTWKFAAATAPLAYLGIFVCVVLFGLL
jgi:hypothetical protein